jgi:opacity protein-like surface antigen
MKKTLIAALALGVAQPAFAAGEDSKVFGEIGVGAGFGKTDLEFYNPTGARFTSNTTTGSYINLTNKDDSDTSFVGYAALGYNVTPNINVHASYQYLGKTQASGGAAFSGTTFAQNYEGEAQGLFVGIGGNFDLTPSIFAEVNGDVGVGFVKAAGTQGARGIFPSASHSNFAWGVGGGFGYRVSEGVSLIGRVNYYDLGNADTALSGPNANSLGMNTDERLETNLKTVTTTLGLRFNF